jgi:hypothetical protein
METRTKQVEHTPGPWDIGHGRGVTGPTATFLVYLDDAPPVTVIRKDGGAAGGAHASVVAVVPASSADAPTPDARLIAAAPILLAIVRRFVALPSGAWHPERHAAEEAELIRDARAVIARATAPTPDTESHD